MEPQRLGSAAGGGIIGALIGVLVSIWRLDSTPVGAPVIYATATGAVLGNFQHEPNLTHRNAHSAVATVVKSTAAAKTPLVCSFDELPEHHQSDKCEHEADRNRQTDATTGELARGPRLHQPERKSDRYDENSQRDPGREEENRERELDAG